MAVLVALNLGGVALGRWTQNLATAAKVLALAAVVWWRGWPATAPAGARAPRPASSAAGIAGGMALAFQAVIWTYYGYPDAAKIAEEMKDPARTLPRVYLMGIGLVTVLYLLVNAAFFNVLPFDRIAGSPLVAADVMEALFGGRAATLMSGLALLVVLAGVNANIFVTPRVVFGLSREGLAPAAFARVSKGGTPWTAMLLVGVVSMALAATGTFERLLSFAILLVVLTDGFMVLVLFRLRRRRAEAPSVYPSTPCCRATFLGLYTALFVVAARAQPLLAPVALGILALAYAAARLTRE